MLHLLITKNPDASLIPNGTLNLDCQLCLHLAACHRFGIPIIPKEPYKRLPCQPCLSSCFSLKGPFSGELHERKTALFLKSAAKVRRFFQLIYVLKPVHTNIFNVMDNLDIYCHSTEYPISPIRKKSGNIFYAAT